MPFPWGQPCIDLHFTCKHCGDVHYNTQGRVTVCQCPGAERERLAQREREKAFYSQQAAEQPTIVEIRQMRKVGSIK